jgi:hypothetical protein
LETVFTFDLAQTTPEISLFLVKNFGTSTIFSAHTFIASSKGKVMQFFCIRFDLVEETNDEITIFNAKISRHPHHFYKIYFGFFSTMAIVPFKLF